MKALIVYHAPHCIDGFTAAWVAYKGVTKTPGNTAHLYPMLYGEEAAENLIYFLLTNPYDWIYVVDFSINLPVIDEIMNTDPGNKIKGLTILDHHKTAFEMYAPKMTVLPDSRAVLTPQESVHIILDNNESGASLAWRHWNIFPAPRLVQHVKDRDIWQFKIVNTKEINMYLREQEWSIDNWDRIAVDMEDSERYDAIVDQGAILYNSYMDEVRNIVKKAVPCIIAGKVGAMVECHGEYASDVGNVLAKTTNSYGMTYSNIPGRPKFACSLRSNDDYDVEIIAKLFGGGGHKNAAGFVATADQMLNCWTASQELQAKIALKIESAQLGIVREEVP